MKAKVLSEKYRVSYRIEDKYMVEDVEYKDAYWRAFQIAGTHRCEVSISRVAVVETPKEYKEHGFSSFLDPVGDTSEVVTGHVTIGAEHFARDSKLSRYHPVNGWVVPESVEIELGDLLAT